MCARLRARARLSSLAFGRSLVQTRSLQDISLSLDGDLPENSTLYAILTVLDQSKRDIVRSKSVPSLLSLSLSLSSLKVRQHHRTNQKESARSLSHLSKRDFVVRHARNLSRAFARALKKHAFSPGGSYKLFNCEYADAHLTQPKKMLRRRSGAGGTRSSFAGGACGSPASAGPSRRSFAASFAGGACGSPQSPPPPRLGERPAWRAAFFAEELAGPSESYFVCVRGGRRRRGWRWRRRRRRWRR